MIFGRRKFHEEVAGATADVQAARGALSGFTQSLQGFMEHVGAQADERKWQRHIESVPVTPPTRSIPAPDDSFGGPLPSPVYRERRIGIPPPHEVHPPESLHGTLADIYRVMHQPEFPSKWGEADKQHVIDTLAGQSGASQALAYLDMKRLADRAQGIPAVWPRQRTSGGPAPFKRRTTEERRS